MTKDITKVEDEWEVYVYNPNAQIGKDIKVLEQATEVLLRHKYTTGEIGILLQVLRRKSEAAK